MDYGLREWRITDAPELARFLSNKNILDKLRDGPTFPYSVKDAEAYIVQLLASVPGSSFCFAVTDNDKAIGNIGAFRGNNIHSQTAELGYYLDEEYWGKGIITNGVKDVCNHIFRNTDIIRIYAEPFADNIASCRVLEKCGFTCEGILRQNAIKNGVIKDMKMYSLLKEKL